jgi:hypothetical protein
MAGSSVALSGDDTLVINNRVMNDLATGTYARITYANQIANIKTGKSNNAIFSDNPTGQQAKLELFVLRGSSDDKYLNNLKTQQQQGFASTVLNFGEYIKNIGDGQGNVTKDTAILSAGVFAKNVDGESNAEGDPNQAVAKYEIDFATAIRTLT